MHGVAGAAAVPMATTTVPVLSIATLFKYHDNLRRFEVNEVELVRLGCGMAKLANML